MEKIPPKENWSVNLKYGILGNVECWTPIEESRSGINALCSYTQFPVDCKLLTNRNLLSSVDCQPLTSSFDNKIFKQFPAPRYSLPKERSWKKLACAGFAAT
jgi:hypothetical protein